MAIMTRDGHRRFRRSGLRIGSSDVVHAVAVLDDNGRPVAVPACRTGFCPVGSRLRPERHRPVNCRRCLALSPALRDAAEAYTPGDGALVLPLEPAPPAPAAFPPAA